MTVLNKKAMLTVKAVGSKKRKKKS